MTSNVVEGNFEDMSYEFDDNQKLIIVRSASTDIGVGIDHYGSFVIFGDDKIRQSRKTLAKFLWAAAYLVDPEQRYAEDEYVGQDYD